MAGLTTSARNAALLALAVLVLLGGLVAWGVSRHQLAATAIAEIEPRHARLAGLQASAADVDNALAERRVVLARHAYLVTQDIAQAGSDAQQRARETFAKAGLEVSSTQVLPARTVDGFDRIPVVLRLEGELAALQRALLVLPTLAPSLFIEGFNVQTVGFPGTVGPQRLNIQVNLFILRVRA